MPYETTVYLPISGGHFSFSNVAKLRQEVARIKERIARPPNSFEGQDNANDHLTIVLTPDITTVRRRSNNNNNNNYKIVQSSDLAILIQNDPSEVRWKGIDLIDVIVQGDISLMTQALSNCQSLQNFTIRNVNAMIIENEEEEEDEQEEDEQDLMLTSLIPALLRLNNLMKIGLTQTKKRWKLGIVLPVIVRPNQKLCKIKLDGFSLDDSFSMNNDICRLLTACETSSTLKELSLYPTGPGFSSDVRHHYLDMVLSLMRKLTSLSVKVSKNVDLSSSAELLKNNQILEEFWVIRREGTKRRIVQEEIKAFYNVLGDNYNLWTLQVDNWPDFSETDPYREGIRCYCRLNEIGRAKLLFDSASGEWIDTICNELDNDLSNIYNFLRKNPSLCVPKRKKKKRESHLAGRKRRRQDLEEISEQQQEHPRVLKGTKIHSQTLSYDILAKCQRLFSLGDNGATMEEAQERSATNKKEVNSCKVLALCLQQCYSGLMCDALVEPDLIKRKELGYVGERFGILRLTSDHWMLHKYYDNNNNNKEWYRACFVESSLPLQRRTNILEAPEWIQHHVRPSTIVDALECIPSDVRPTFEQQQASMVEASVYDDEKEEVVQVLLFNSVDLAIRMEAAFCLERLFGVYNRPNVLHWYEVQHLMKELNGRIPSNGEILDHHRRLRRMRA